METHENIIRLREKLGLSQEALAAMVGYKDRSSIAKVEAGKVDLSQSKIAAFAKALNVTPAQLMGIDSTPSNIIPPGFEPLPRTRKIPLIGSIACGEPITAEDNIEDYVDAPEECNPDFALRCKGDSMIEAGIEDGDIVYIRKAPEVKNGEIAAVRIGDEATLKYVYWDRHILTLVPANKSMVPRTYSGEALEDIHIEGKAVGFTHWFK